MEISTHKLSDCISLTLRSPAGNKKKPVIILCHGFVVSEKFSSLILQKYLPVPVFPPSRLTIGVLGAVTANADASFLLCKLTILFPLLIGQENSLPSMHSVLAYGEHHLGGCHVFGAAVRDPEIKCIVSQLAFADGEEIFTGKMNEAVFYEHGLFE